MDFTLTMEQVKTLKELPLPELEIHEKDSMETYNTIGQIRVTKLIKQTESIMDELCLADESNWYHRTIKTSVLEEYDGMGVFIKEYPPKLRQFINTVNSDARGMSAVSKRWGMFMLVAINQLRNKGFVKVETPAVAIYRFRTPYLRSDADNFSVKILNDSLRDARFITDDSFEFLSTYVTGVYDSDQPGTEIFLVPKHQFGNLLHDLDADLNVTII